MCVCVWGGGGGGGGGGDMLAVREHLVYCRDKHAQYASIALGIIGVSKQGA